MSCRQSRRRSQQVLSITSDGRGLASLTSAYGTYGFDFVLYSTSSGLITEYDANGTGSGTLDLQTAVTSLSALAGRMPSVSPAVTVPT